MDRHAGTVIRSERVLDVRVLVVYQFFLVMVKLLVKPLVIFVSNTGPLFYNGY